MNKTCGTPTTYNTTNCTFSPNPAMRPCLVQTLNNECLA